MSNRTFQVKGDVYSFPLGKNASFINQLTINYNTNEMNSTKQKNRRAFIGTLAAGATAGITLLSNTVTAGIPKEALSMLTSTTGFKGGAEVDKILKEVGKMQHAVGYDVSQANQWGFIWSNVYYITNEQTGTTPNQLGVLNVLRHHGIIFSFNDDLIKKYKLGEMMGYKDPITKEFAVRNPYLNVKEGTFPVPGLDGIEGLQSKGTKFCVCNMAYKVYAGFVAQGMGITPEEVYNDFVANKLPGIELAPSGVWVLGRLAENRIAYIDSSVG